MLSKLAIHNYALIDSVEIDFGTGLNIITGETGAGKSILMGALGLITGQRADSSVLSNSGQKCIVEGTFSIGAYSLVDFFTNNDLDYLPETLIRREINTDGKSRAFINDTPVTLATLKELGDALIDIHSQHQTLGLGDKGYQLAILDAVAGNTGLLAEYKSTFSAYKKAKAELNSLLDEQRRSLAEADYINFQLTELLEANLQEGEQETLENELQSLTHAEDIKQSLFKALGILGDGEQNVLTALSDVKGALTTAAKHSKPADELLQRLQSSLIELKDIHQEIDALQDHISFNPNRTEEITNRLDTIYRLQKKHNLTTVTDLLALQTRLDNQTYGYGKLDTLIAQTQEQVNVLEGTCTKLSTQLSKQRSGVIPTIIEGLQTTLADLGMPHSSIEINLTSLQTFANNGVDDIAILFSANKGAKLGDLVKTASGGELSRVMLAIKALVCSYKALPTIVFDEIDTGVSGEMAYRMGSIMAQMGERMQVVSITHLPQIAGKGAHHFKVYKQTKGNKTQTFITPLNSNERVEEVARMLSGDTVSEEAMANARKLIAS